MHLFVNLIAKNHSSGLTIFSVFVLVFGWDEYNSWAKYVLVIRSLKICPTNLHSTFFVTTPYCITNIHIYQKTTCVIEPSYSIQFNDDASLSRFDKVVISSCQCHLSMQAIYTYKNSHNFFSSLCFVFFMRFIANKNVE